MTKREGIISDVEGFAEGSGGNFVWPIVVKPMKDDPCWKQESVLMDAQASILTARTFAPILQVAEFETLEEAIRFVGIQIRRSRLRPD